MDNVPAMSRAKPLTRLFSKKGGNMKRCRSLLLVLALALTAIISGCTGDAGTDTTAPYVPTSLVTTATSTSQINLTWTASTDNVGVTGYKIYRDGSYLKSATTISTLDSGLTASTQYCYQITAYDAAGNESAKCMQVCATTHNYRIYSFEGVISTLYYDGAGIIANGGYKIGDSVFAKFNVDFASDGYYILNNGETLIPENPQLTNDPHWYFYNALIEGTLMPVMNGGFFNGPTDVKEYYCGYADSGPIGNSGVLEGGTGNSSFTILKESLMDASVQNWVIGEHFKGIIVSSNDKDDSVMWADMILIDIQTVP
jgi:hypothetical protein